ncbi:MAG: lipoate--protein ligase [Clostridia bacterium]
MSNQLIVTESTDPWTNLAMEEYLFDTQGEGATLYLWQNQNTVVIGRNQNAWKECRVQLLENEGGRLARRSSGGGAVFHDLGNLNFTFILPRGDYNLLRQFAVIQRALQTFGIMACISGRNDLALETGEKFSGNAFRFSSDTAMHHGTILINADMDKMMRYLAPSKQKMQAKGVDSVRSRVRNLTEVTVNITIESLIYALTDAFSQEYGDAERLQERKMDQALIETLRSRYASWDWRYGKTPLFDISLSHKFDWGELELLLTCQHGCIEQVTVFTDAMDETLADRLSRTMHHVVYTPNVLAKCVASMEDAPAGLADWLAELVI